MTERPGAKRESRNWLGLYRTGMWKSIRLAKLRRDPLCHFCQQQGRIEPATVVDHIKPHKGDFHLFFAESNLQSLCKTCHDGAKQRMEKQGKEIGCDAKGIVPAWK